MSNNKTPEEKDLQLGFEKATYGFSREDLENKGERVVRDELNSGKYGHSNLKPYEFVSAWLADKDFVREREQESVSVRLASRANKLALIAIIIAAIAAHEEIKWLINSVISLFS